MADTGVSVWQRPEVVAWLQAHSTTDPAQVALGSSPFGEEPSAQALALQLQGWQKARTKLPTYAATPGIAYPPTLSMEQCSSEATARWKGQWLKGQRLVDLTAGFGVDAFFLGQNFDELHLVEQQAHLARLAQHNLGLLRTAPFYIHTTTCEDFLAQHTAAFDGVYLDPARRDDHGGKVFRLHDCTPDVVALLPQLLRLAPTVLLKASPMLDIQQALTDLGGAQRVVVLAVRNEVKELLFFLGPDATPDPELWAVNLTVQGEQRFAFRRSHEKAATANMGGMEGWLYEPNASVLKAGAFQQVATAFGLTKLHPNTHLYTSAEAIAGFPGRRYRVVADVQAQKKAVRKYVPEGRASVATRNFPMPPAQLQQKLGLKEGGQWRLMGYTNHENQKRVVVLERNFEL